MNISIKGAYGEANFGDDLLMLVFENYFLNEFPDVRLNFEGDKSEYPTKLLKQSTYNKKVNAEWLIYGGGTQFFSFQGNINRSFFDKVILGIKNPKLVLNKLKSIKEIESNSAFLGFGLGPFNNDEKAINLAINKLNQAEFVGVRDEVSYKYCKDWGINAILGADVVFSSYFDNLVNELPINTTDDIKHIGIIIRDWEYKDDGSLYIDSLMKFYEKNKSKYNITFVVFSSKKDLIWIKKLKKIKTLIWDPEQHTVEDFLVELSKFSLFVSARYHGAIIGALLNKPVICIEIEPKLRILTEQIKEFTLWEKPFYIDNFVNLINHIERKPNYQNSLEDRKFLADKMLNDFKEFIRCKS